MPKAILVPRACKSGFFVNIIRIVVFGAQFMDSFVQKPGGICPISGKQWRNGKNDGYVTTIEKACLGSTPLIISLTAKRIEIIYLSILEIKPSFSMTACRALRQNGLPGPTACHSPALKVNTTWSFSSSESLSG